MFCSRSALFIRLDGSITPKAPLQMQSLSKRGTPTPPALSAGARQVSPRSRSVKEAIRDPSGVFLCPGLFLRSFFHLRCRLFRGRARRLRLSPADFFTIFSKLHGGAEVENTVSASSSFRYGGMREIQMIFKMTSCKNAENVLYYSRRKEFCKSRNSSATGWRKIYADLRKYHILC